MGRWEGGRFWEGVKAGFWEGEDKWGGCWEYEGEGRWGEGKFGCVEGDGEKEGRRDGGVAEGEEEGILKGCVDEGLDSWE